MLGTNPSFRPVLGEIEHYHLSVPKEQIQAGRTRVSQENSSSVVVLMSSPKGVQIIYRCSVFETVEGFMEEMRCEHEWMSLSDSSP